MREEPRVNDVAPVGLEAQNLGIMSVRLPQVAVRSSSFYPFVSIGGNKWNLFRWKLLAWTPDPRSRCRVGHHSVAEAVDNLDCSGKDSDELSLSFLEGEGGELGVVNQSHIDLGLNNWRR